jgi:hypothetical protein
MSDFLTAARGKTCLMEPDVGLNLGGASAAPVSYFVHSADA